MELPPRLASALSALTAALDRLEAAAVRRNGTDTPDDADREIASLRSERDTLLAERAVDASRIATLLRANDEVVIRLQRTAAALRRMADRDRPPEPDGGQG